MSTPHYIATALTAALLCFVSYKQGYRHGHEAGLFTGRLAGIRQSGDKMLEHICEVLAAMATGYALGYKKAKAEKVQNDVKKDILENLN